MSLYEIAFQWQTLISGVIALAGAAATVIAVLIQINANRKIEDERRQNEAYAARSVLPQALNEIIEYAEQCMDVLDEASRRESVMSDALKKLPHPPGGLLPIFRDAIRFSDNERQRQIADLLSFFQVHEARLISLRNPSRAGHTFSTLPEAVIDSARLYAMVARLFPWARREEEGRPQSRVTYDEIVSAIRIGVRHYESNAGLRIELDRRRPKAGT
ncbi:hypothetical protein EEDFHM_03544 [Methylorubrum populi]